MDELGPQAASDDATTRRHRFHQSWFLASVLGLPFGTGPSSSSTTPYGNMLRPLDADAGANFLTPEIDQIVTDRISQGGTVEPFRCRHNMLSSQPMCCNLFGPMTSRPGLAAVLVEAATGRSVGPATTSVVIEDSPGHLGDNTGMDASIRYATADGARGILAVETKLTESFSPKVYELDSRPVYREYSSRDDGPFDPDRLDDLTDSRRNQLWRNQMLAESVRVEEELDHAEQLVVHPEDAGGTADLVTAYAGLLRRPDAVGAMTLRGVVDVLRPVVAAEDVAWLDAFHLRYVNLGASQRLFEQHRR